MPRSSVFYRRFLESSCLGIYKGSVWVAGLKVYGRGSEWFHGFLAAFFQGSTVQAERVWNCSNRNLTAVDTIDSANTSAA